MIFGKTHHYLLAFGSNQRHHLMGSPRQVIDAAVDALEEQGVRCLALAPVIETPPLGPSARHFCNSCAVAETKRSPPELLRIAKRIERNFGRKLGGQAWRARVIDIDLVLWSGGIWADENLALPHSRFRERHFVLKPAQAVAPDWRDPVTGLSVKHLYVRLTKPRPATR